MKTITYDETKYRLVPATLSIPADAWEAAQFAFGGPGTGEGEPFMDCTAWVGECKGDDGEAIYGLHLSCDECPEEGRITLATFSAPEPSQPAVSDEMLDRACEAYCRNGRVWGMLPAEVRDMIVCRMRAALEAVLPKGGAL